MTHWLGANSKLWLDFPKCTLNACVFKWTVPNRTGKPNTNDFRALFERYHCIVLILVSCIYTTSDVFAVLLQGAYFRHLVGTLGVSWAPLNRAILLVVLQQAARSCIISKYRVLEPFVFTLSSHMTALQAHFKTRLKEVKKAACLISDIQKSVENIHRSAILHIDICVTD